MEYFGSADYYHVDEIARMDEAFLMKEARMTAGNAAFVSSAAKKAVAKVDRDLAKARGARRTTK